MHPPLYICIFTNICKYAKYGKYRGGKYANMHPRLYLAYLAYIVICRYISPPLCLAYLAY